MCCYWLFSSDCDWLKSPDSEWLFQPDSNTVIEHNLLLVTGIVKKMVYRTAPIGGDRGRFSVSSVTEPDGQCGIYRCPNCDWNAWSE